MCGRDAPLDFVLVLIFLSWWRGPAAGLSRAVSPRLLLRFAGKAYL